jgi:hypothetical protein
MFKAAARAVVVGLALLLTPVIAGAGLLADDSVSVLLTAGTETIFSGTVDPSAGIEVTVTPFRNSTWQLDLLDNGFSLTVECISDTPPASPCNYEDPEGVTLELDDLDFTPAAALIGLTAIHDAELTPAAGSPVITPSKVTINFVAFDLATPGSTENPDNSSGSYVATFQTQQIGVGVPLPATIGLLAAGLGLAALARHRPRR